MDQTTSFAKLPPFSCSDASSTEGRNKWQVWLRGFEICLRACKISDSGEKRDMLLAQGGIELQEIFFNIPEPEDDKLDDEDPYKVAIDMIDSYFTPKNLEIEERHQFWSMKRGSDESLAKFLERVQEHASKCNFGETATESQNFAVIDKMLQVLPGHLKKKLLRESTLTIDDMIKRVNDFDTLASTTDQTSKNASNSQAAAKICKACGQFHGKELCPAKKKNCYNCGKPGHLSNFCYSVVGEQSALKKTKRSQAFATAKQVSGPVVLKQGWKKNYAQIAPPGSLSVDLAKERIPRGPWKKDYAQAYPFDKRSSDEPAEEGRAMKYARRMYGMEDVKLDYAVPRDSNYSEWSSYHHW